jgi:hypothetical protein
MLRHHQAPEPYLSALAYKQVRCHLCTLAMHTILIYTRLFAFLYFLFSCEKDRAWQLESLVEPPRHHMGAIAEDDRGHEVRLSPTLCVAMPL